MATTNTVQRGGAVSAVFGCTGGTSSSRCKCSCPRGTDEGQEQWGGERDERRLWPDDSSPRGGKHDVLQDGRLRGHACRQARHLSLRCGRRWCTSGTVAAASSSFSTSTVPQVGRELVEVPNVVSQVVEQNVDIPVRRGRERSKNSSWRSSWSTLRTR